MSFGSETSDGIENSLRVGSLGHFTMGREKEGELTTMFLEFEYHASSLCEMLISRDDISDDLSRVFHCVHLSLFPLCAD